MSVPTNPLSSTAGDSSSGNNNNNNDTSNTSSYIDYPALTAPTFSAPAHANRLVLSTNLPSDPAPLDLSTPLSRVLFDVQEIDSHLDTLTTSHALPLVSHASLHRDASRRLLDHAEDQVRALTESYERLEREIRGRYANAETVRVAAERMLATLRLGRGVQRCVNLGRQVEGVIGEVEGRKGGGGGGAAAAGATGDCRALVPVAHALLGFRGLFAANGKGEEGEGLGRVAVCNTLRAEIVGPAERTAVDRAKQVVGGFSMSSLLASSSAGGQGGGGQQQQQSQQGLGGGGGGGGQTYAQTEDMKTRATSALQTLYLLSPTKKGMTLATFEPTLLIQALQNYLNTALTSSVAALARALATLPTLDRTLLEISARCQNIAALESLLSTIKPPHHPLLPSSSASNPTTNHSQLQQPNETLLDPLLRHLDTSSLPSYFWRSMAGQLSSRVQDILARGGVSARTLRTNRDRVRDSLRECVDRGTRIPSGSVGILLAKGSSGGGGGRAGAGAGKVGNWEREAAVMVGAVVGPLMQR
ncbi:putative Golgi transport complex component Cog5 [Hortaea werneckii]|nr:putative Golgi transport complex component Cog5 [Hortaea werneckii]